MGRIEKMRPSSLEIHAASRTGARTIHSPNRRKFYETGVTRSSYHRGRWGTARLEEGRAAQRRAVGVPHVVHQWEAVRGRARFARRARMGTGSGHNVLRHADALLQATATVTSDPRRYEGHMRGFTDHLALISGFLLIHRPARAQQGTPGPVTTVFRADAERLSRNLVAAADDMPATKYQFKPTPAQMSVAEVVLHLAGDSEFGCAALGGAKAPAEPKLTPADSVPKLVARLTRAFAFCRAQMAKLNDGGVGDKIPGSEGQNTAGGVIFRAHGGLAGPHAPQAHT